MANLSVKLNLLPGITRDINLTLEDLLASFNSAWSLEDRLELILGLDLGGTDNLTGVSALATIFNKLDVNSLTVGQLLILDTTIKDFKSKIDSKKEELIKSIEVF
jgi:hypothetical protein